MAISCKKEPTTMPTVKNPYLVSTVQKTSYGTDSFLYAYTGNIITGMNYYFTGKVGGFYNYNYNVDSNIVWWSWNTLPNIQQYSYVMVRANGKIMSLTWFAHLDVAELIQYKALFKYNGNKLDSVFYTEDYKDIGELDTSTVFKITYTGNDITKIATTNISGGNGGLSNSTTSYTYDNITNGFAAVNKNYWLLGYNYRNTETFDVFDAIITLSAHNITSETSGTTTTNYTYTKDASGNIIASSGGGKFYLDYR